MSEKKDLENKKTEKKRSKKTLVVVGVVVALLAVLALAAVLLFARRLDSMVAHAIEEQGSAITGTSVTVQEVDLSPWSGEGRLLELTVANPAGYEQQHALRVGAATVRLDPASALSSDSTVVIHDVEINSLVIGVEGSPSKVNILELQKTIKASRGDRETSKRRLKIGRLEVNGAKIEVVLRARRRSFERTIEVPDFALTDLGGEEGATAREISKQVFATLAQKARTAVGQADGPFGKLRRAVLERFGELTPEERQELRRRGGKALKQLRRLGGKNIRERIKARRQELLEERGEPDEP